jgi:hypothetical protein
MSAHGVSRSTPTSAGDREHRLGTFLRHLVEMTVAMMLGMCILGMAFRGIHTALRGRVRRRLASAHGDGRVRDDVQHDVADGALDASPRPHLGALRRDGRRDVLARASGACAVLGRSDLVRGCASVGDGVDAPGDDRHDGPPVRRVRDTRTRSFQRVYPASRRKLTRTSAGAAEALSPLLLRALRSSLAGPSATVRLPNGTRNATDSDPRPRCGCCSARRRGTDGRWQQSRSDPHA